MGKKSRTPSVEARVVETKTKAFWKSEEYSFYSIYIYFTLFLLFILLLQLFFFCCFYFYFTPTYFPLEFGFFWPGGDQPHEMPSPFWTPIGAAHSRERVPYE
jgi:hypothetical protein